MCFWGLNSGEDHWLNLELGGNWDFDLIELFNGIIEFKGSEIEMDSKCKTIVWFRRDLRIENNPALAAAARDGSILPVFIWCPKEEGQFYPGRVSRWWLKQSLIQLEQSLKSLGAELVLIKTQSTLATLLNCSTSVGATKLVYNHLYGQFQFFTCFVALALIICSIWKFPVCLCINPIWIKDFCQKRWFGTIIPNKSYQNQ